MRAVLRELLATGFAVGLCGCAGSPPPAVIQPTVPEAAPPVQEVVAEPIVEVEPEPVRAPEPPLADRWRAPFAVSSSGRAITRAPRSVTVLASDSAIAVGMAAVNDASGSGASRTGSTASNTASSTPGASGSSPTRAPAGGAAAAAGAAAGAGAGAIASSGANRGATTPPPATATDRGATPPPAPTGANRDGGAATQPRATSPGATASPGPAGASGAPAPAAAGSGTPARGSASGESGVRLIGDPIQPGAGLASASSSSNPASAPTSRAADVAPTTASGPGRPPASAPPSSAPEDDEAGSEERPGTRGRSAPGAAAGPRTYTVESGDSWIGIARDHGVSFSQLQEANPGANPERIRIGQVLRIPPPTTSAATTRSHRVGSGDTLSEIAERYGVSVRSIRAANDLSSDVIRQGQVLTIPAE